MGCEVRKSAVPAPCARGSWAVRFPRARRLQGTEGSGCPICSRGRREATLGRGRRREGSVGAVRRAQRCLSAHSHGVPAQGRGERRQQGSPGGGDPALRHPRTCSKPAAGAHPGGRGPSEGAGVGCGAPARRGGSPLTLSASRPGCGVCRVFGRRREGSPSQLQCLRELRGLCPRPGPPLCLGPRVPHLPPPAHPPSVSAGPRWP